jgi:wobble nucleotide-excising tRNase
LKTKKTEKSVQLKDYSENVLAKYRSTINEYLAKFGAEFEIVDPKTSLQGGKPSATYMLKINNVVVPLGTTETVGEPCFRTILSDGDKNSLAFAIYMAQLKLDPDIANKTLIIDDPITSLDIHRKNRTFQEIREISNTAKQTIVLSHDAHFLKLFWDGLPNVRTFQIVRDGNESSICEWDIQNETLPSYLQDYFRLENYLSVGDSDLRGVVRCIRPVLEGNLRFRFPKSFEAKEWLGDFLGKIRGAGPSSNLAKIQPFLPELSAICVYSSRYHHQQNPLADKEEVLDSELKTYVTRTLSLLERL